MHRPFISFLSDFGPDAAAAICRGVMLSIARDAQILDISHDVRKFAIREGAYLLWMAVPWLPIGVHVAVVDPGVGTARRPVGLLTARGDVLIGPDNGLLEPAAEQLGGLESARVLERPDWMLPHPSATFHGRDIFAPMAAHLAIGGEFASVGPAVNVATLVQLRFPRAAISAGALDAVALYVDSFGNIRLGATSDDLIGAFGELPPGAALRATFEPTAMAAAIEQPVTWSRTFGGLQPGAGLLYRDSSGQLAVGRNQADAAAALGVEPGRGVQIERA